MVNQLTKYTFVCGCKLIHLYSSKMYHMWHAVKTVLLCIKLNTFGKTSSLQTLSHGEALSQLIAMTKNPIGKYLCSEKQVHTYSSVKTMCFHGVPYSLPKILNRMLPNQFPKIDKKFL
jgi:hypothetical protein